MVNNILIFYFIFELLFTLIIFSILLLGYSLERLVAGYLILFYSFLFSSPSLFMLIIIDNSFLIIGWITVDILLLRFLIFSFIVKFPVFGFHYWLPVAHVEASTIGSIILARVLLKIGGIGALYIVKYINYIFFIRWLSLGVLISMLIILVVSDMKIIVAYSSVAHISLVYFVIILGFELGIKGGIFIIFYHGIISSLMFWLVGLLSVLKSRNILVIKYIRISSYFIFIVFIIMVINIGFPPFMGFLSEVLILKSILKISVLVLLFVFIRVLISCYYNAFIIYSVTVGQGLSVSLTLSNLRVLVSLILILFLDYF